MTHQMWRDYTFPQSNEATKRAGAWDGRVGQSLKKKRGGLSNIGVFHRVGVLETFCQV